AQVAVVDFLAIVVLDLHDLVARAEGPAETFDAGLAGRVQRRLQLDVEGACAKAAPVHRAQHLDVTYGIEPEALRDALAYDCQQLSDAFFRVGRIDEKEVAAVARRKFWHRALVDAMRIDND